MIHAGDIFYADLADAGRRPVLVVSAEYLNRGDYVVVVAFTTRRLETRRHLPNCVFFRGGEHGLSDDCVAQCDTIASVPVNLLDAAPVGRITTETLRDVIRAIGSVIDSDCEPMV